MGCPLFFFLPLLTALPHRDRDYVGTWGPRSSGHMPTVQSTWPVCAYPLARLQDRCIVKCLAWPPTICNQCASRP